MVRALWLCDVLKDAGLKVLCEPGWPSRGGEMKAIQGILCHHTAGSIHGVMPSLKTVRDGRPGLKGPLSHLLLDRDGTYVVVAGGRCNHAGKGKWPGIGASGNSNLLGIEAENTGQTKGPNKDPWPEVQLEAYARGCAAILQHLKLPADRAIGHKEWAPTRKIDPTFDMKKFRERIRQIMAKKKKAISEEEPLELIPDEVVETRMPEAHIVLKPWEQATSNVYIESGKEFDPLKAPHLHPKETKPEVVILPAPGTPADKVVEPPQDVSKPKKRPTVSWTPEEQPELSTPPGTSKVVKEAPVIKPPVPPVTAALSVKAILEKLGWKDYQAAALVAQAMAETGPELNPEYEGPWLLDKKPVPKGTEGAQPFGFGIMGWFPDRVKHLEWFTKDLGEKEDIWLPKESLEVQTRFIDWELRNTEKVADAELRASDNTMDALRAAIGYVRPLGWSKETPENIKDWKDRVVYAYQLLED